MKRLKKFISLCFIIATLAVPMSFSASAASGTASISVSSSAVNVGDTVIITANYNASEDIGSIEAYMRYDSSVLEWVSGDSSNSTASGAVKMSGEFVENNSSSIKLKQTFKAKKAGVSSIRLETDEFYSVTGGNLGNPSSGTSISVKDVSHTLSSNANLKSLSVSAGSLSPSFNADTTSYTVSVPYETTSLTVSAVAADSGASVSVSNMKNLSVGNNKQTISVTAADGTRKNYYLNVVRGSKSGGSTTETSKTDTTTEETTSTEETQVTDEYPIDINGTRYKIVSDLTGIDSPGNCFTLTTTQINDADVSVYKHNNADITLVYLMSSDSQGMFSVFDAENGSFSPFVSIPSGDSLYVVVDQPSDAAFDKYTRTTLSVGDNAVDAWNIPTDGESSDFYVLYAVNPDGVAQWYQYDTAEKTVQRYFENTNFKEVSQTAPTDSKTTSMLKIAVIVLSVIVLALVIVLLLLWQKSRSAAKHFNEW